MRSARMLFLYVAFGAAVSVATAWACAATIVFNPSGGHRFQVNPRPFGVISVAKADYTVWTAFGSTRVIRGWIGAEVCDGGASVPFGSYIAVNRKFISEGDASGTDTFVYTAIAEEMRGWPCRCLRVFVIPNRDGVHRLVGGAALKTSGPDNLLGFSKQGEILPTLPIWKGLLANALFFGMILYLVPTIYRSARSRWRRSRGLCQSCGYVLSDVMRICPECGIPVSA